ncbi:hypothetical protein Y1Q_0016419 [Alligator mississippiensis]|uniref:Uncharacterized protein n=1 Tax=Alligator mississippiensis TaxID=8496 RepID=A0A151N2I6_ALLMI|nr:hypothetical protein Y1Q_0016419 [Alligator mississippiensis]
MIDRDQGSKVQSDIRACQNCFQNRPRTAAEQHLKIKRSGKAQSCLVLEFWNWDRGHQQLTGLKHKSHNPKI